MSLFRERVASSKKIVALENEIINLKQQINSNKKNSSPNLEELDLLKQQNLDLQNQLKDSLASEELLSEVEKLLNESKSEISVLKSDLKKARSENTRLKKKLAKFEEDSDSKMIFEDS